MGPATATAESSAADSAEAALTPMMRQYQQTKAQYPDAVLFFRLGDFYEMFAEDAIRASEILQIALTSRAKGTDRVPMCGVPYHSARRYIAKLIERGLKVAICEQTEEAGLKPGLVRREVVRVITPGMVLDEEVLDAAENNFLAAVCLTADGVGAALLDASTGEFFALQRDSVEQLAEELSAIEPRELLVADDAVGSAAVKALVARLSRRPALASIEAAAFEPSRAQAYLRSHFEVATLAGFGLGDAPLAASAAGAALRYVKDTQKATASHVDRLSLVSRGGQLLLDDSSRANLEVLRTLRDGSRRGALLGVLDRTLTAMGARKLSRWLIAPLSSLPEIHARLDAVEQLAGKAVWREELAAALKQVGDLERLCGRLSLAAGNARDLRVLARSLEVLPDLAQLLEAGDAPLLRSLCGPLSALGELCGLLTRAVADEPPLTLKDGGMIRAGYDATLDELVALSTSGKDFLLRIEQREKERTGISSLKIRFNKVFGYYIEITRSNLHLVPTDYIRKQTTVGAERYVTPELKSYEEKVLSAEEQRCTLEYRLFEELRGRVVENAAALRAAAEAVATADVLASFARCAAEYGYARPDVDDSGLLEIVAGRHPVVERVLEREVFVPNDLRLDRVHCQLLLITGPNMAGKSTVMRQVALITLMAHAGSFVPAQRARIGLCDRIFTRVGASDNLAKGQSTFMVEMTETSHILHHATRKSLVILDEIGRGTSTFDGLSIAWAVAEHLHDCVGARTLFATHYHELTDLAREKTRVKNCSVAVQELKGKIVFLRKLVPGGASRSYGIEVAKLAGLPPEVLARAKEILGNLESEKAPSVRPAPALDQLPLFAAPLDPASATVLQALRSVELNEMTPLQALNALARWKKDLSGGSA